MMTPVCHHSKRARSDASSIPQEADARRGYADYCSGVHRLDVEHQPVVLDGAGQRCRIEPAQEEPALSVPVPSPTAPPAAIPAADTLSGGESEGAAESPSRAFLQEELHCSPATSAGPSPAAAGPQAASQLPEPLITPASPAADDPVQSSGFVPLPPPSKSPVFSSLDARWNGSGGLKIVKTAIRFQGKMQRIPLASGPRRTAAERSPGGAAAAAAAEPADSPPGRRIPLKGSRSSAPASGPASAPSRRQYVGVHTGRGGTFVAQLSLKGKSIRSKPFETAAEAAREWCDSERSLRGRFSTSVGLPSLARFALHRVCSRGRLPACSNTWRGILCAAARRLSHSPTCRDTMAKAAGRNRLNFPNPSLGEKQGACGPAHAARPKICLLSGGNASPSCACVASPEH